MSPSAKTRPSAYPFAPDRFPGAFSRWHDRFGRSIVERQEDQAMSGRIRVGIGGWTYEPWRGTFYPEGLRQKDELAYVGAHLTATEINATYYGTQKPATFANWAGAVPDGFRFAVKASRFCTNRRVLADAGESV